MDIIKYMNHLDNCLMERIDNFENLGQSPQCDCGLKEAIQQVKNNIPDVSISLQDRLFKLANDFAKAKQGEIAVKLHTIHNELL